MARCLLPILLVAVGLAACAPPPEQSRRGRADQLVVSVRPGFHDALAEGIEPTVEQAEMVRDLSARLGRSVVFEEAADDADMVNAVGEGRADLAVGRLSLRDILDGGLAATTEISWVEDLVVSTQDGPVVSFEDLANADLAVTGYHADRLRSEGSLPDVAELETVPPGTPTEAVLRRVASGFFQATVADSALVAAVQRRGLQLRVVGPVAERRPVVWGVRADDPGWLVSVNEFLFAEKVLGSDDLEIACRDLDEIRDRRLLRVITRNAPATVTVDRGGLIGFEYDLALSFARSFGARVELVLPPPEVEPVEWLQRGFGDMAALHEPPPLSAVGVFVSHSYRTVDLVAVVSSVARPPTVWDDMAGLSVSGAAPVLDWVRQIPVGPPPVALRSPRAGVDGLAALEDVRRGRVFAAVVDSDTADAELEARPALQPGPVVVPDVPLTWLVNPAAPELLRRADRFLARSRRNGLIRQLELNAFGGEGRWIPRHLPEVPEGALTPFDEEVKEAASRANIDWRLLASLMYEESRFDPGAVGPGGSAGLFQFMPFTWRELGIRDPHDPAEAADGGARYLAQLMESFSDMPLSDRVAMAIASYNVGPRHVFDARALAEEMGLDRNRWRNSVETALVLLDNPETARRFPAGVCRCRRAVGYTRRILRRYAAYRAEFPPLDADVWDPATPLAEAHAPASVPGRE
jgi:membrane-bound lytic murein transglycosylase F